MEAVGAMGKAHLGHSCPTFSSETSDTERNSLRGGASNLPQWSPQSRQPENAVVIPWRALEEEGAQEAEKTEEGAAEAENEAMEEEGAEQVENE